MKTLLSLTALALLTLIGAAAPVEACGDYHSFDSDVEAAKAVVSADEFERAAAIRHLRRSGPAGLETLEKAFSKEIKHWADGPTSPAVLDKDRWLLISKALDGVAQQKDAHTSGLFWHTSMFKAKAEAEKTGKPILVLRLLGRLTDEFSCANSRFFRTALYANTDVSKWLRDSFVLVWETERPVPKVTIDMGDGRKLECTITGNSAHYVLDAQGNVIDCVPGLYGPAAFKRTLERAVLAEKALRDVKADDRAARLKAFHAVRLADVETQWKRDLEKAGVKFDGKIERATLEGADAEFIERAGLVPAEIASRRAMAKSRIERAFFGMERVDRAALDKASAEAWVKIGALRPEDSRLDGGSVKLMRSENPTAEEASTRAVGKGEVENPFFKLVRTFENSIAVDTVRNEYLFHAKIHDWFAKGEVTTYEKLNERVYAELFFTPASDPWLGLVQPDTYTGLKDAGVSK